MILADKEADKTLLDTLTNVAFHPLDNNKPNTVGRRNLIEKLDKYIKLAENKDFTSTQQKWVTDSENNQRKVEFSKCVMRWLTASVDGKVNLIVRYGSEPLKFTKRKNAIELVSEAEVADTLCKIRETAELVELVALIEQQTQFGIRVKQKNK